MGVLSQNKKAKVDIQMDSYVTIQMDRPRWEFYNLELPKWEDEDFPENAHTLVYQGFHDFVNFQSWTSFLGSILYIYQGVWGNIKH